jgi:membrane protein YqaA with SNARE-associated domain
MPAWWPDGIAWIQAFFTEGTSLWWLFAGSFVASTIVPVSSEAMLFAVLKLHPELFWFAIGIATIGNTLGGLTTYAIGRLIAHRSPIKYEASVKKHGVPVLLLSWMPLVGDALCLGAGWLRLHVGWCIVAMAVGKAARYVVVAFLA